MKEGISNLHALGFGFLLVVLLEINMSHMLYLNSPVDMFFRNVVNIQNQLEIVSRDVVLVLICHTFYTFSVLKSEIA